MDISAAFAYLLTGDFAFLCFAALLAGMIRGFSGFGTALVFIPLSAIVLDPVSAVATIVLMDLLGPVPVLWRIKGDIEARDLSRLVIGAAFAVPLGLFALTFMPAAVFRITASSLSLVMLVILLAGWRLRQSLPARGVIATGAASGFLGGVAGIPGPPVIFAYFASTKPARVIRANISAFLYCFDWLVVVLLALSAQLTPALVVSGLALSVPNMVGNLLGAALFRPEQERVFRAIAYTLVFAAALAGLPLWNWGG